MGSATASGRALAGSSSVHACLSSGPARASRGQRCAMLRRSRGSAGPDGLARSASVLVGRASAAKGGGVVLGGETQFRALVTGVSGQDGWYLAERLLAAGLRGARGRPGRRPTSRAVEDRAARPRHARGRPRRRRAPCGGVVDAAEPDRIFNLAGSTSVARSWDEPVEAADVIGIGAVRLLNAAWRPAGAQRARRCVSSRPRAPRSSATRSRSPQDEDTAHAPVTPYGAAKDFAHTMVQVYRRRGMFASAAILYNHESPRRPASFVARKITRAVAAIARGSQDKLDARQHRRAARLGLRARPRRRHAADPGRGPGRRLRRGDRRGAQRPRLRARRPSRRSASSDWEAHVDDRPGALPARRPARPGRRRRPGYDRSAGGPRSASRSWSRSWCGRTWTSSTARRPADDPATRRLGMSCPTHPSPPH